MLGLILAAFVYNCPVVVDHTQNMSVTIYYDHNSDDLYEYSTDSILLPGTYDVNTPANPIEGHPVGILWSDGTFCGRYPGLLFEDGFESGNAEKWNWSTE